MTPEEIEEHKAHFEDIIYDHLKKVLEDRPRNPLSKFAKAILKDAGLNDDGDPIADQEVPKFKDRVKVSKDDLDDAKAEKKKSKSLGDDSDEEERAQAEKAKKSSEAKKQKKKAKKAKEGKPVVEEKPPAEEAPAAEGE